MFVFIFLVLGLYSSINGSCMEYATKWDTISSQGMQLSSDEKACLIHDSTYPPLLHKLEYGPEYSLGVNMDRGGMGLRSDGTYYACLFDGTSGGGLDSAYAAQDFTDVMLDELGKCHVPITEDNDQARKAVTELMVRASFAKSKKNALYGDATCVFIDIAPESTKGLFTLNGGALGDSGIIHVDGKTKMAYLFETILKDDRTNTSDTGGCVSRRGMLYRPDNISVLSKEVISGDFVVLASDGLLDNLSRGEESEVLSLIINSTYFDAEANFDVTSTPSADDLKAYLESYPVDSNLTAEKIATRLNRYIRMLTLKKKTALQELLEAWEAAAKSQNTQVLNDLRLRFRQNNIDVPGKCDDCLVIVVQV